MAKRRTLNPHYIPTPLIQAKDRPAIPVLDVAKQRRVGGVGVVLRLVWFGVSFYAAKLLRRNDAEKTAIKTRRLFETLGGAWIKVGQLLSLRSDLFPDAICQELSRLQFSTIAFPSAVARQVIEEELGRPLTSVFAEFDDTPIAAASVAQVHTAVLWETKVPVVVKVQMPYTARNFRRDMALLRRLVKVLSGFAAVRHMRLNDAMLELNSMVEEEINFTFEASNLGHLRNNLLRQGVYAPYLFRQYSSQRMLVMEKVSGVLMSEVIAVKSTEPERFNQWCAENHIKPKKVAERLLLSTMEQILEDNMFHGDMHPGNILLLRHNRFALIDFGTVGNLEREFLDIYLANLRALANREYAKAAVFLLHMCPALPSTNLDKVRADLVVALKQWHANSERKDLPYHERSLTASDKSIGPIFAKYRMPMNWSFLRLGRTLGTLDTSLAYLAPDMRYSRMLKRYFEAATQRRKAGTLKRMRESIGATMQTAQEYNMLLSPMIQRATLSYKQQVAKFSAIIATVVRYLRLGIIGLIGFLVYSFLHQHHFSWIEIIHSESIGNLVDNVPLVEYEWFVVIIIGLVTFSAMLRRVASMLDTATSRR